MSAKLYKFIGKFREKVNFIESIFSVILLGPWSKPFPFLSETIQSGYQYCIIRANRKILEEKKINVEKKFSTLWRKISAGFVKTSFHMFMRTVWAEEFFETTSIIKCIRTLSEKIQFLSKMIWPSCGICILRVYCKNLGIKIWVELFSRHWLESLQYSFKNYGPGLSNLQNTSP